MEQIVNFIKPELLILIPVLYFIGTLIKKSDVKDKYIPLVLTILGVVLATLYVVATSVFIDAQSIAMGVFVGITQGILCVGASVYCNQLSKQKNKGD